MPVICKQCPVGEEKAKTVKSMCTVQSSQCSSSVTSISSSKKSICGNPDLPFEELKDTLAEIVKENFYAIEQAFIKFDRQKTGKILRSQMKQVLRSYCLPLTIHQFNCIVPQCKVDHCGKVYYREFLEEMTGWISCHGMRAGKKVEEIPRNSTTDEIDTMLKFRIERNLKNIIRAFYHCDHIKDGFLKKRDVRKVLEKYCFRMSNEQFYDYWSRIDPLQIGLICYGDLVRKLGVDATNAKRFLPRESVPKALCWPVRSTEDCHAKMKLQQMRRKSAANGADDDCVKGLAFTDTLRVFIRKLQTPGLRELLTNGCLMYDMRNTGYIYCEDLHALLNQYVLSLSTPLFVQLLDKCMPPSRAARKICWREFIQKYCCVGTPLSQSPECQPYFDTKIPVNGRVMGIIEKMKRHIIDPMHRLTRSITAEDLDDVKLFNRMEVKKLIQQMNFFLPEEEFRDLFAYLDPGHTNYIKIQDFLTLFDYPVVPPCPVKIPYNTQAKLAPCKVPYAPEMGKAAV